MYKTTTATYTDKIALKNVDDELVNKGVPRENFFIDEKILQIKVMMPESEEQEIMDILNRHGPTKVHQVTVQNCHAVRYWQSTQTTE